MRGSELPIWITMNVTAVGLYGWALRQAPWKRWFLDHPDRQHVWGCSLAVLAIIWSMRTDLVPGLPVQLLMVTTLTLMHGWALAVVGIGFVLAASCAWHGQWSGWSVHFLCDVALPACFIELLHKVVARRLRRSFISYLFLTVFAGSVAAFYLSGLARLALLAVSGSLPGVDMIEEYSILLVMMAFADATINGMMISAAVIYRPEWVVSFDPDAYR
jgi:uncharacterized membrane protein